MTDLHGISASDFAKWRVPCCFYLAEKAEDLDKAVGLEQLVAPFRAHREQLSSHHATRTYGPCAVVLPQVKAAGLVQAFDLLL
ncbi:MAG: hypothetical protein IJJ83_04745 [Muribaculaceae bacterium]|nr:hypothetical protein [Muribaculaceae bacterium]